MRKTLFLLLALAAFLPRQAVAGDVAIASLTVDKTTLQTSEDFTVRLRVRNNDPAVVENVLLSLSSTNLTIAPMHVLSATIPAGWRCTATFRECVTDSIAGQAETEFTYHLVAPSTILPSPFAVKARVGLNGADSRPDDNEAQQPVTLVASNRNADLSISVSAPPNPIPFHTPLTLAYDVRNNGPQDLNDVRVSLSLHLNATPVYEGAGWTCTQVDAFDAICRRDSLAANANAPLAVRFTTPGTGGAAGAQASVFAVQPHFDADGTNGRADRSLSIGEAAEWERLLAPFAAAELPGANGSLWKTEISAVIEAAEYPSLGLTACGPVEDPCSFPPLNRLFDASDHLLLGGDGPQFVYIGQEDAAQLRLTTRVYDASKSGTTAGAFVPTARDDDFSAAGFSLIAIPHGPELRSTLRIYDSAGIDDRDVELVLHGDDETEPFLRTTVRLHTVDRQTLVTSALLPLYPASAQVNLSSLVPAAYTRVRVAIRPMGNPPQPEMKLWGFTSITNNETSHVTVVTP